MKPKSITMKEWTGIISDYSLSTDEARSTANALTNAGIIEIVELRNGLKIASNSFVGKIILDDLQINILPKIDGLPLYKLLRYAYGLRDLKLYDSAIHAVNSFSFFDLLIYELYFEAEDLLKSGLLRKYMKNNELLSLLRGKINLTQLSRTIMISTDRLPCVYLRDQTTTF